MLQDHLYFCCFNSRLSHVHWRKLFRNHGLSAACAYCYWVVFFLSSLSREMKKYMYIYCLCKQKDFYLLLYHIYIYYIYIYIYILN